MKFFFFLPKLGEPAEPSLKNKLLFTMKATWISTFQNACSLNKYISVWKTRAIKSGSDGLFWEIEIVNCWNDPSIWITRLKIKKWLAHLFSCILILFFSWCRKCFVMISRIYIYFVNHLPYFPVFNFTEYNTCKKLHIL